MDETTNSMSLADYYAAIKAEHDSNNAWSAEQAQKAMDWQAQQSATAHQREVADLKAAGLNPVLSAGGQGATTGSGITAQRSDENIQALYGLVKESLKANMAQANAMQNTAKYISGSNGSSNPIGISPKNDKKQKKEKEEILKVEDTKQYGEEVWNALARGFSDLAKGKVTTQTIKDLGTAAVHVIGARAKLAKTDYYQNAAKRYSSQYGIMNILPGIEKVEKYVNSRKKSH